MIGRSLSGSPRSVPTLYIKYNHRSCVLAWAVEVRGGVGWLNSWKMDSRVRAPQTSKSWYRSPARISLVPRFSCLLEIREAEKRSYVVAFVRYFLCPGSPQYFRPPEGRPPFCLVVLELLG